MLFRSETWVVRVILMAIVVVVVDPHREPRAQALDERKRGLLVARPPSIRCKRDVQHDDTPRKAVWLGQLTGRSVRQMRETAHVPSMWRGPNPRNSPMPGSVFPKPMPWGNKPEMQASHRSRGAAAEGALRP